MQETIQLKSRKNTHSCRPKAANLSTTPLSANFLQRIYILLEPKVPIFRLLSKRINDKMLSKNYFLFITTKQAR